MKSYILSIIGAAVLSSFASMLTPDKWRKYTGIVAGLVVMCCIITPFAKLSGADLFSGFEAIEESEAYSENLQREIFKEELEKRVSQDVEARLLNEFGIKVKAAVSLNMNENNEITGITRINMKGEHMTQTAKNKLCQVYGISEDKLKYEQKRNN